ncbi:hypothetical protein H072_11152 [Dactylellina haptotyla CBS 200.50]|uniref:ER transporter 6TM N-terminal domain-containing protein n=1 Tax=Dactylellina haptotyla (strain CBS 200.50) TaxID=1284197 RepID=S8A2T5_DACHA|nr:hypothetical protein H072_11152 [Dactylellina haptotyla CBS 200.50]
MAGGSSNTAQHKPNSGDVGANGVGEEEAEEEEEEEGHANSWVTTQTEKAKRKTLDCFKQLLEDLKKDRLWQHILKCSVATLGALITCLIPTVATAYGPAVFLSAVASVFGHPGRTLGAMLETLVFALVGTLVGTGWVTLASYISDKLSHRSIENAHAFRAVMLALSMLVHGYLRSKVPKLFVGILLFLLTVIIQMTTPVFVFSHQVATAFLYPFLTGIVLCTLVNILIFPEFSSGKVAIDTVKGLELALETLRDATEFFVCPSAEILKNKRKNAIKGEKEKPDPKNSDATAKATSDNKKLGVKSPSKKSSGDKGDVEEKEDEEEDPLKKLLASKDKLRKALASSKATLKETSFELSFSCLPPARLHAISSTGLESLVMTVLTLIVACETKHIVMGPADEDKDSGSENEKDDKDDDESDKNSLKEKLENIRPKREAEIADEEFLRHLLERVDEPLAALRSTIRQSLHAVIACVEFTFDVPLTTENTARKPKGIPLKEIDIYVAAIETSLEEFDKRTREALHKAAEKASEEEEVEFDILPREEIFLVSSFLLNFRLAAQTTLDMLREGREMVEEYESAKRKRSFHLPNFKSRKWLFSGGEEQSEAMDAGAKENVSRYQKTTGAGGGSDQKAISKQRIPAADSKKASANMSTADKKKKSEAKKAQTKKSDTKKPGTEKLDAKKSDAKNLETRKKEGEKAGEEEAEKKPWPTKLRDAFADVVDWVLLSRHFHYALKLAIGGMLLAWPAFVPAFSNFFYNYRGLWVVIIYILVFENSVGTSIQIFAYRTVGTICGSIWGYAAWSAGNGNAYVIAVMLYFGFLVAFYIQLNTRYVKAGMVLTISMVVVSIGTEIGYIPGTVPGTALDNFLKRAVAMIIGGLGAVIVQSVIFPVKARVKLVETVGMAVLKINEMESAIAFGVDQTANISDLKNENAVKAFYKARKKADVSLAAASAYLSVSTQEPRIKASFANDKLIFKEIIYVLHQIIDRMENVLQLRLQLGSALLENYYPYVYKYRRNVAAAITITLYAVHEALTSKLPLPQYFPSARLAQLRMVNRVRQILIESVSTSSASKETQEAEDAKRTLRVEFMSYNASSAALEQVIEWLEELVDLTKLLRGAAEFRFGLLSRPTYKAWVRQISIGGEVDGASSEKEKLQCEAIEESHHQLTKVPSRPKKLEADDEVMEDEDGLPETLRRVQSRYRENRAGVRRLSQSNQVLPERVDALRRAARGL